MPIEVEIEGIGIAEFPDGTSDEVIQAAVKRTIASKTSPQQKLDSAVAASAELPMTIAVQPVAQQRDAGPFPVVGTQNTTFASSGEAPTRELVAMGLPIAGAIAGTALAANPVAGFAAGSVIGNELVNVATGYTPTAGERVTQVVGMAPIGVAGNVVKQGVVNAAQQIAAKQVGQNVQQAVEGQSPTLLPASELVSADVLAAGAFPAIAQGANRALAGTEAAIRTVQGGGTLREAGKALAVGGMAPTQITPEQQQRNESRARLEALTGKKLDTTIAEITGNFKLAGATQEITAKDQDATQRLAAWTATKLKELPDMDAKTRAEFVQAAVRSEGLKIGAEVADDVASTSARLATAIGEQVQQASPASMSEAVNRLRASADTGLQVAKEGYNKAYEEARKVHGFSDIVVVPKESTLAAFKILDVPGITIDPKVKRVIDSLDLGMDYDSAKALRSYINDSIGTESLLPGISDGQKKFLAGALTKDMDSALSENPKAASLMREADTKYAKAQEAFNTLFAKQTVREVGEEGGSTAATIVSKLTGRSGDDFLKQLRAMEPYNSKIIGEAKDSVLGALIEVHGDNAAGILGAVKKMAPAIKKEMFPNYAQIEALATREAALSDLPGVTGESLLKKIRNVDEITKALTTRGSAKVNKEVEDALKKTADLILKFKNDVIQDATLAAKNPNDFVDGITTGRLYSEKEIADVMAKLPEEQQADVKRIAIGTLLREAGGDAVKLNAALNSRDQAPRINTLLGEDADFLRKTVSDLEAVQPTYQDRPEKMSLLSTVGKGATAGGAMYALSQNKIMALGAAGAVIAKDLSSAIPRLNNLGAGAKYNILASFLNTPNLRELAVTPLSQLNPDQVRLIGALLSEEIRRSESQSK